MRTSCRSVTFMGSLLALVIGLGACHKEVSNSNLSSSPAGSSSSSSPVIAVAVAAGSTDSIYILQTCSRGYFRDSIPLDSLPAGITTYLDTTYTNFTDLKQFVIKDSAGTVGGYLVIISYNNKPVALLFNASGQLVEILEQRERGDLNGPGWHRGGRYGDRDGSQRDTIALSALPSSVTGYMSASYPNDTLIRAWRTIDSSYLILSQDNGLYATVFNSGGSFVKRVALPAPSTPAMIQSVAQSALPAAVTSYLSTTYPNYVFDKAFSLTINGHTEAYAVVIDANNSKYSVLFDGSGNYLSARVIW